MVESFGALVAITLTILFASTQGPSGDRPRSIRDSKAFASLVNLTEGRACNPTSCRISTDARILFITLAPHQTGVSSSAVRRTASRLAPEAASVAAMTAPSTTGALQTTTRSRRDSGNISIAISLLVSAPPRSTRIATPRSDHARSIAAIIASTLVPKPPPGSPPHQPGHFTPDHLLDHQRGTPRHV